MSRSSRWLIVGLLVAGAAVFVWQETSGPSSDKGTSQSQTAEQGGRSSRRGGGRRGPDGPVSVLVATARTQDVPVTLDAVGTIQALNTVTVRSQVDGRLVEVAFREGQDVKRGDVLARIDPATYQAQYDQAVAKKAQDEATLANARLDLQRYVALASTNAGSRQQADTQKALVAQTEALVKSDQAAIDNAKAVLDYTVIRAPLDGRLGIRQVDQGNIVRASDATGLVVITQLKPIALVFNLAQQHLRAVTTAMAKGTVPVEALEADNTTIVDRGRLEVVDNLVDQQTGTVKLKAIFPNDAFPLWPGAFVNVRLTTDILRGVVVVPTGAVQRGPNGPFVYVVEGEKAVLKPVTLTRQTEDITVLASGIRAGEQVITTGFARLTNGDRVTVAEGAATAPPSRAAADGAPAAPPPAGTERNPESRPNREGRPGERGSRRGASPDGGSSPASPASPASPNPAALTGTGNRQP